MAYFDQPFIELKIQMVIFIASKPQDDIKSQLVSELKVLANSNPLSRFLDSKSVGFTKHLESLD